MTLLASESPPASKAFSAPISMRRALSDRALLGAVLAGPSWLAWRTLLIALMGEELTAEERAIFAKLTAREREPLERVEEVWIIAGRRGGKSRATAVLIVFLAAFVTYGRLALGERPVVLSLAQNGKQAAIVLGYVVGIMENVPMLAALIRSRTAESLELKNGVTIEVRAASFRGVRGVTALAVVADEIAYWHHEETNSANPAGAILDALRPSLATTGGPLIAISSPYDQRGPVYETWRRDYGADGDPLILVAQGASRDFNPSLPQKVVDRAMERDPAAANAEYMGLFRTDVVQYLDRAVIEAAVDRNVMVRPPVRGVVYRSGTDPSGGMRDSFTVAVAHDEGNLVFLDCILEIRAPFDPSSATAQIAAVLKLYGLTETTGDKYAAQWTIAAFAENGIRYTHSERDRSAIYSDALPLFTSGKVRLLDNKRLVSQFAGLERRTSSIGKDRIDHGPHGNDDVANAAALALIDGRAGYMPEITPAMLEELRALCNARAYRSYDGLAYGNGRR